MEELVLTGANKKISLTPAAIKEVKRLIADGNVPAEKVLRLGVKGGGCAGFSYILEFDNTTPADTIYDIEGIKVAVDLTHQLYLDGTQVDFQQGLNNRGFIYSNPNASKTCGCGESFG